MIASISNFLREEDGNAVEYAMVVALIGLALTGVFTSFISGLTTAFTNISTTLINNIP